MEKLNLSFRCKVVKVNIDGFLAALQDGYIIKFKDNKLKHFFSEQDELSISVETIEYTSKEDVRQGKSIIYVKLNSFVSNGFLFEDAEKKSNFFWMSRGLLTYKKFEDENIFSSGDLLKIIIKRNIYTSVV